MKTLQFCLPAFGILLGLAGCEPDATEPTTQGTSGTESAAGTESGTAGTDTGVAGNSGTSASTGKRASRISFTDRTEGSEIQFEYRNGEEAGNYSILESLGGGAGAIDYDLDGLDDICLPGGGYFTEDRKILGHPTALYRNAGGWKFRDVSKLSGLHDAAYYSHGATRIDFDNDGWPDVLITGYGGVELFHNMGDGTFERLSAEQTGLTDKLWSSTAAAADLNGDSHPDLYVAHYVNWSFENDPFCEAPEPGKREICPPRSFEPLPDVVYYSNGDGTFRDATQESGIRSDGKGLSVVVADMDLDHDVDVYVTNDTVPNALYQNDGQGILKDASLLSGTSLSDRGVPDGSMGVDIFDYNNDGQPEIWVVNYERETSALYQNLGSMVFRHVSQRAGINAVGGLFVGWGTCCYDYDLDGDEDMFVSNGHVIRYPTNAPLKQLPLMFENIDGKKFENAAPDAGSYFRDAHMGRGASAADFDNDGDMDLVVSRTNQPAVLVSNESPKDATWIQVQLNGTVSSREPVGAMIRVISGKQTYTRYVKSGGSYASSFTRRSLIGLGSAKDPVSLEVQWPSGKTQLLENIPVNSLQIVIEPK